MEIERIARVAAGLKQLMNGPGDQVPDQQAADASQKSEQRALEQVLSEEPRPRSAERESNRSFALPADRTRQEKVRHVDAHDQEHDSNQSHQDPEGVGLVAIQS